MLNYKPVSLDPRMGQTARTVPLPVQAPPPTIDPVYSSYDGIVGILESGVVLTVFSAAAWVGIRAGTEETGNKYVRAAGWVGGIGVILMGLLYLGAKSGVGQELGIPAVRISPF